MFTIHAVTEVTTPKYLAFGAPTRKASLAGKTRHGPMQSGEARLSQMWKD